MKGEAQSFNWLKDKIFEIPFFQRPYVWKEDNWDELWNSIVSNPLNEMPFMGSFILQVKDTKGQIKYTVIDGQQRLTTLSILIKSFLDSSADLKNDEKYIDAINEIESYIKYKEVKAMETKKIPRIIPSSVDKKDFINVMELINLDASFEKSHNILRCYQFFINKFSKCNKEQRLSIGTKFRSDIKFFIAIELDPKDDEQKIFDSVNRLGMKLLNSDIIKNNLYQRLKEISPDDFDVNDFYKKNWVGIYQVDDDVRRYWEEEITIGRTKANRLDEFLKNFATIKGLYVASQTGIDGLSKSFKDYANSLSLQDLINFIEEITEYAKIYYDLFNEKIEDVCFEKYDTLKVLLLTLKITKTSTFNPYLLKLIYDNPLNLEELLLNLEKFIIKRLIYKVSAKNYNKVCEQLLKVEDAINYLENYSDDSIEYLKYPKGLLTISNDNAKLILLIIELIRRRKIGEDRFSTLAKYSSFQLEHILPQNWRNNWSNVSCYDLNGEEVFEDEEIDLIRDSKKKSIGNMTLLKGKLNNSISNGSFKSKIKGNGGHKGIEDYVGGLLIAKEIVDLYNQNPEWNEKNIYKRDKELFTDLNDFYKFINSDLINNLVNSNNNNYNITNNRIENKLNIADESTWSFVPYRDLAFELVKDLLLNNKIDDKEIELLCTPAYTHTIIKNIKNALLALPIELDKIEWKRKRYSKKIIEINKLQLHVSNQFSKKALEELIVWYKNKKAC